MPHIRRKEIGGGLHGESQSTCRREREAARCAGSDLGGGSCRWYTSMRGVTANSSSSNSFTYLILSIDEGDAATLWWALAVMEDRHGRRECKPRPRSDNHGPPHITGWAACLLEPRDLTARRRVRLSQAGAARAADNAYAGGNIYSPCHVFLGTCVAFTRLFRDEIIEQVNGYVRETPSRRTPHESNRLRTLALAAVNDTP